MMTRRSFLCVLRAIVLVLMAAVASSTEAMPPEQEQEQEQEQEHHRITLLHKGIPKTILLRGLADQMEEPFKVHYEVKGPDGPESFDLVDSVCVELSKADEQDVLLDSCTPVLTNTAGEASLGYLGVGEYDFFLYAKHGRQEVTGTRYQERIVVKRMAELVPHIQLEQEVRIVLPYKQDKGDVELAYQIGTHSVLDESEYAVCLRIIPNKSPDDDAPPLLTLTCLATDGENIPKTTSQKRTLTLSNVPIGQYLVTMYLRDAKNGDLLETSAVYANLFVKSLDEELPLIEVPTNYIEEVAEDKVDGTATVTLEHWVGGEASAKQLVRLCIRIAKQEEEEEREEEESDIVKLACVDPFHSKIALTQVLPGKYVATYFLSTSLEKNHQDAATVKKQVVYFNSSSSPATTPLQVVIEVRQPTEFVPSYEWQDLKKWHTIPTGVETRLPLDGKGKQCRIPDPWRLQVSMPSPCKFFLRMDVQRDTTIKAITSSAAHQCHNSASEEQLSKLSLAVLAPGNQHEPLDPEATVEDTDLFNKKYVLFFRSS